MDNNASVCVNCGFGKGTGFKYCANCGAELMDGAEFCVNCGMKTSRIPTFDGVVTNGAKSKIVAGILGILLGSLGIHNFYLGFTKRGLTQLLMSVLSCGILSFASGIWGLVEGILILTGSINTDADGMPLKD